MVVDGAASEWIVTANEACPADLNVIGGKAVGLAGIAEAVDCRVPAWFAVTVHAFEAFVGAADLDSVIMASVAGLDEAPRDFGAAAASIQEAIRSAAMPAELASAILSARERFLPADALLAVRSSAVGEDGEGLSFAGLHDSFMFVGGGEELLDSVRDVWASAYTERALTYRFRQGMPLRGAGVAVVVQAMVDALVSGVMFTANPSTGNVHEVVVNSLYGAGEGLVGAGLEADTYVVAKDSLEVQQRLVEKKVKLVRSAGGRSGLERVSVPEEQRDGSSLDEDSVRTLARVGLSLESWRRRPLDIEFCLDAEGSLWLLQARPITTLSEYGPAAGNRIVWDNSNIIESYSGVTSPMTFSFIRRAYSIVYRCFAEVMGIPPAVVRENASTFESMLGLFHGQVYYNLLNWYRLVSLFPGFNYNRRFMESMMGVKESTEREGNPPPSSSARRYFLELPALLRLAARSGWNFLRIKRIVRRFQKDFRANYDRWQAMDLGRMAPHELMALYREMERKLLWRWQAPIINDFFVMVFYGMLRRICASWCGDQGGSLQNDLLCGEGGIESTKPTEMLMDLARMARHDEQLRRFLLEGSLDELVARVPEDPRFPEFASGIARYLEAYGFRCAGELKLEEPSLHDRPQFVYEMIRNYLRLPDPSALDVEAMHERQRGIRREAETRAVSGMRKSFVPRRIIFRWVLRCARLGVRNRENMRFARTRIYGLVRELLRAMGGHLAAEGVLADAEDVFYLTLDETWDYVKGTAVTTDLGSLVELRRREFDGYRKETQGPDDRFETYGMAYCRNTFRTASHASAPPEDGVLKGVACCPGEVEGAVRVVRAPGEGVELAGEILVAERTDPGWVTLYASVSGILIERGSILSHSAIVAREMGIPTIVGIPGLCAQLANGVRVRMDGATGTVRVLDGSSESTS